MNGRWTRTWAASILVCVCIMVGLSWAPATADPPEDSGEEPPVEVELARIDPTVIQPGDDVTFAGTVTNNTSEDLTDVAVLLRMQRHVPSQEDLSRWLHQDANNNVTAIAKITLDDEIPAEDNARFEIKLDEDETPFDDGSTWGPRGVEVAVPGSETASDRSVMTWFPDDDPDGLPASLTTLAPLQPTASEWDGALDGETSVAAASEDRLRPVLDELADAPITWAVDPVLLEPVPLTTQDITEPEATPNPVEDAITPPTPQLAEDISTIVDAPVVDLGYAAPDYQALAGEHPDPGLSLLNHGSDRAGNLFAAAGLDTIPRLIWPTDGLDQAAQTTLDGIADARILAPSSNARPGYLEEATTDLATLIGDQDLSENLLQEQNAADMRELVARSALAVRALPDSPILLTLPRNIDQSQALNASATLTTLADLPWFENRGGQDLSEEPTPGAVDDQPHNPTEHLSLQDVQTLASDAELVQTTASLTEDPTAFAGGYLPETLGATAAIWRDHPDARTRLIDGVHRRAERLTRAVTVETPSTINLISRGGEVPITVANSLPVSVNIQVELQPEDARLRAQETVSTQVSAQGAATVRVPIHAVANGNVHVDVHILDANGREISDPKDFSIRVRADWEDTGTAVVAAVLLTLFIAGLTRTIRRGRRTGGNS